MYTWEYNSQQLFFLNTLKYITNLFEVTIFVIFTFEAFATPLNIKLKKIQVYRYKSFLAYFQTSSIRINISHFFFAVETPYCDIPLEPIQNFIECSDFSLKYAAVVR